MIPNWTVVIQSVDREGNGPLNRPSSRSSHLQFLSGFSFFLLCFFFEFVEAWSGVVYSQISLFILLAFSNAPENRVREHL